MQSSLSYLLLLLAAAEALRVTHMLGARPSLRSAGTPALSLSPQLPSARSPVLRMLADETKESAEPKETPAPAKESSYSTVFDDETPPATRKDPLSSEMRARLLREQQGLGADPNSGSPFLAVFGAVGLFVILGALAVNF